MKKDMIMARTIIHNQFGFMKGKIEIKDYRLTYDIKCPVLDFAQFNVCGIQYLCEFDLRTQKYKLYATVKEVNKYCGRLI